MEELKALINEKTNLDDKLQEKNQNTELPSNGTLNKIIKLLFECQEIDKKTNTVKMNQFEHYCDYITNNW
jgi:hypothetical protein